VPEYLNLGSQADPFEINGYS